MAFGSQLCLQAESLIGLLRSICVFGKLPYDRLLGDTDTSLRQIQRRGIPKAIVPDIHAAYLHPYFRDKAYAVLMSGPSGSADIGGKPCTQHRES